MTKYSVSPFSGKSYERNERKATEGFTPCAICGKPVKDGVPDAVSGWPHVGEVVGGGSAWGDGSGTGESDPNDPGYMGVWPIGNDCHRKYAIKPAAK